MSENNKITLVTAFLPIGRGDAKSFQRSDDQYLEYFAFWARIRNDLVIYTTSEWAEKISLVREKFGLKSRTKVIVKDDFLKLDSEMYEKMVRVCENKYQQDIRLSRKNPEVWNAKYNYVMSLKYYFLQETAKELQADKTIAWIDFGFNHGGEVYASAEEFDFEWRYNFDKKKIHMFNLKPLDDTPIFKIVQNLDTYIQGSMIVLAAHRAETLWRLFRKNMFQMISTGLIDDDQTVLLMCVRDEASLFHLVECRWHLGLSMFSNHEFTIRPAKKAPTGLRVWIAKRVKIAFCLMRQWVSLSDGT